MSIVFYHNDAQRRWAVKTKAQEEARWQSPIHTEIVPYREFYLAEVYHQKYRLRSVPDLVEAFTAIYPGDEHLITSTAAARVNGYLGGHGTCEELQEELESLGLPDTAETKLQGRVCRAGG
jgi:hypothetical protein